MSEEKEPIKDITKVKISKEATLEEMQEAIRQALVNPDFELPEEEYQNFVKLNEIEDQNRQQIIEIIGPYYDELKDLYDPESTKRKDELMDIARYIQVSKKHIKLIEMGESPDFIVEVDGERIGLEHTRIFDKSVVEQVSILDKICQNVQEHLKTKHPSFKGLFNVRFNSQLLSSKIDRKALTFLLEEYIESLINKDVKVKPDILEDVIFSPHSTLEIVLSEKYLRKDIDSDTLDALISKKEAKLQKYKENCGLKKIWLLVIADGATEKSDSSIDIKLLPQRDFTFDKIIVLNTFKGTIIETLK